MRRIKGLKKGGVKKDRFEWSGEAWSPISGCTKISPGCARCYAEKRANRFFRGKHGYSRMIRFSQELFMRISSRCRLNGEIPVWYLFVPWAICFMMRFRTMWSIRLSHDLGGRYGNNLIRQCVLPKFKDCTYAQRFKIFYTLSTFEL